MSKGIDLTICFANSGSLSTLIPLIRKPYPLWIDIEVMSCLDSLRSWYRQSQELWVFNIRLHKGRPTSLPCLWQPFHCEACFNRMPRFYSVLISEISSIQQLMCAHLSERLIPRGSLNTSRSLDSTRKVRLWYTGICTWTWFSNILSFIFVQSYRYWWYFKNLNKNNNDPMGTPL